MTDRRRIILADARRRFRDGQRLGLGWTWSQCLRTAAQADRIRRNEPRAMLAEAAAQIRAHVEIATPPGRLTGSSERAFERGRRRPTLDG